MDTQNDPTLPTLMEETQTSNGRISKESGIFQLDNATKQPRKAEEMRRATAIRNDDWVST